MSMVWEVKTRLTNSKCRNSTGVVGIYDTFPKTSTMKEIIRYIASERARSYQKQHEDISVLRISIKPPED
jgi:ABC-type multidrug transport system ATPase subunit